MKKYKIVKLPPANELSKYFPYKVGDIVELDDGMCVFENGNSWYFSQNEVEPLKDKFISFTVAPYCLPKLLLSFYQNGIHNFSITQQDNDLCVSVGISNLERVVYPRNIKQDKDMKKNDDATKITWSVY